MDTASSSLGSASLCTQLPGPWAGDSFLACAAQATVSWRSCSTAYTSHPDHQLQCPDQSHGCSLPPYLQPTAPYTSSGCLSVCLVAVPGCLPLTLAVALVAAAVLSCCPKLCSSEGCSNPCLASSCKVVWVILPIWSFFRHTTRPHHPPSPSASELSTRAWSTSGSCAGEGAQGLGKTE